jgi:large subunit ribosomal protein L3
VTVIELGPNFVTQLRTPDRDGYSAVQLGFSGRRKRLTGGQRGHLRASGLEREVLSALKEYRVDDTSGYTLGQQLDCGQFTPGTFVDLTATSKGRGWAGGVKRWNFRGGPKTHGQSDRHRAPGSLGAGTTPGRVYKGQHMAGHMGDVTTTELNVLVVACDPSRNLLFVAGSVPGPRTGIVSVRDARRPALKSYTPPVLPSDAEVEEVEAETAVAADAEAQMETPMADAEQAEAAVVESAAETPADGAPVEAPGESEAQ